MENPGQEPKSHMGLNSHPEERGRGCFGSAPQSLLLYARTEFQSS
jgi:hypothetical protein